MISNQLGRRNISDAQKSYYRGMQYEREKKKHGGDRKSEGSKGQNVPLISTAEKLATQHNVTEKTIKRDEQYANAVDKIAETVGTDAKNKILTGDKKITKKDVIQIGKDIEKNNIDVDALKKDFDSESKKISLPKQDKNAPKKCKTCKEEFTPEHFYIGHDVCKDCEVDTS